MKNPLEGIDNNRLVKTEQINDLEDRRVAITQSEQQNEKRLLKNEDIIYMHPNTWIIGIQEEERENRVKRIFEEIISESFTNLGKKTDIQIQEAQRVPKKMNPKSHTRKIVIKVTKVKDKDS